MGTSIDGIVSGLDTTALIDGILGAAAVPLTVMEDQLTELEDRLEAVSGIKNRLDDLATAIEELDEVSEFASFSAGLSEEGYLTVSTDSAVNPGSYEIEILSLSDNEVEVSQSYADKDTTGVVSEGTLNITYGTTTTAITIDSTNSSLEGVASAINDADLGVTAYVINNGDSANPYQLVIQGDDTGSANTITLDTSGLAGGTTPSFTQTSTATDAQIVVNGVSVTGSSDTFADVVPGLTIEADAVTVDPVTVSVSTDEDALVEKVQGFVDAYNAVIDYYNTNTAYSPDDGIRGGLVGESSVRSVINDLGTLVSSEYSGVSGAYTALSMVGIATESDGKLTLDTEALTTAIQDDYDAVEALFTTEDDSTSTYGPMATIRNTINDLYLDSDTGILTSRTDSLEESISDQEDRIADFEDYLASYEERLRDQFTNMEVVLADLYASQDYLTALFNSASSGS